MLAYNRAGPRQKRAPGTNSKAISWRFPVGRQNHVLKTQSKIWLEVLLFAKRIPGSVSRQPVTDIPPSQRSPVVPVTVLSSGGADETLLQRSRSPSVVGEDLGARDPLWEHDPWTVPAPVSPLSYNTESTDSMDPAVLGVLPQAVPPQHLVLSEALALAGRAAPEGLARR